MSLFQSRFSSYTKGDDSLDVVHLGAHGCDVMFSSYDAGTCIQSSSNAGKFRGRIINGKLTLTIGQQVTHHQSGSWFEIPARVQHSLHYNSNCDIIEFWFAAADNN